MKPFRTRCVNGGMPSPKSDIKNPEDFQSMANLVRPEDFKGRVFISSDIEAHRKHIQEFVNMVFERFRYIMSGKIRRSLSENFQLIIPNKQCKRYCHLPSFIGFFSRDPLSR